MKIQKLALALGALTASGLSMAQSSVTLFGVMDVGVTYAKTGSVNRTALNSSQGKTSLLGFRGVEDLGGGTKAEFWLEGGINPDTGAGGTSGALAFERRATVGLIGSWGEVRLGRDYTPTYNVFTAFGGPDTTTGVQANLFQDVRALAYGGATTGTGAGQSGTIDRTRASNAIGYFLPSGLGGVYGQLQYALGDENRSDSGANKARQYLGGNLGYRSGPLNLGIGYGKVSGNRAVTAPPFPAAIAAASDLEDFVLGASYNFGVVVLSGGYNNMKWEPVGGTTSGKAEGYTLSGAFPLGSGNLRVKYGSVKFSGNDGAAAGLVRSGAKAEKYSVGYVYNLSKRTSLYTGVARVNNTNNAALGLIGGTPGTANTGSTGLDLGLTHTF